MEDRRWMGLSRNDPRHKNGIIAFLNHVADNGKNFGVNGEYRCPCKDCTNDAWYPLEKLIDHLAEDGKGIMSNYRIWEYHGEAHLMPTEEEARLQNIQELAEYRASSSSENFYNVVDQAPQVSYDYDAAREYVENAFPFRDTVEDTDSVIDQYDEYDIDETVAKEDADKYRRLLSVYQTPLYAGCTGSDRLTTIMELMSFKEQYKVSNVAFDKMCTMNKKNYPEPNTYPGSFAEAQKVVKDVGLGYETYDACEYSCSLYYAENLLLKECPICEEPRYDGRGKAKKTVRHFSITEQLQKLYSSPDIAQKMKWHAEREVDPDILRHPADGEAWIEFDRLHPRFRKEKRNVRLAVATDGFCPFGTSAVPYSMWPVVVVPYNLPPNMCMQKEFNILSLVISGPKSPGKCLNNLMRPLIDELQMLWDDGVVTFDESKKKAFTMRAAVLWTISDFPGLGMLGGIQTKGYLACPICLDDLDSRHSHNRTYYYGARKDLKLDHKHRKDKKNFDGQWEMKVNKPARSGGEVYNKIMSEEYPVLSLHPKFQKNRVVRSCWTHRSIFWDLPYWHTLGTRHALDVMHIEKNVCDNILGTLLNLPGKTKDDLKARQMWKKNGVHRELWPSVVHGKTFLPYANYTVRPEKREEVLQQLGATRFPSGYAGWLKNKINIKDKKFYGLKTHDCHVLLQRILPIIIRPYVAPKVATVICDLADFFKNLCSRKLSKNRVMQMKTDIIDIMCRLEMIFPPPFHTIMLHLCKHLPDQILQTGPVHYTWMFPMERELGYYKSWIRNPRYPEGCIAEAYILHQCSTHINVYLEKRDLNISNDPAPTSWNISVVKDTVTPLRPIWKTKLLDHELNLAHWTVMTNCDEAEEQYKSFTTAYNHHYGRKTSLEHRMDIFYRTFECTMAPHWKEGKYKGAQMLFNGVQFHLVYKQCNVDGVKFLCEAQDKGRTTQNSGVMLKTDSDGTFYGVLEQVIKLIYAESLPVVLFKCRWFDSKKVKSNRGMISIPTNTNCYQYDPYCLAISAQKIFYVDDPNLRGHYKVVNKIAHRGNYCDFSIGTVPRPSYQVTEPYQEAVPYIQPVDTMLEEDVDGDDDQDAMVINNIDEDVNDNEEDDRFLNDDNNSDEEDLNDEQEFNDEILSSDEEDIDDEDD